MKLCCALVGLAATLARGDEGVDVGGEGHHRSCACEAEELNFSIDCGNRDAMLAALAALGDQQSNNCQADCTSEVCRRSYLIVQSHHDYCLHDEVPEPLEDAIHFYEEKCEDCAISRKPDPNLPDCPTVSCGNGSGDEAYRNLLTNGCLDSCNTMSCQSSYRILRAVHDTCPEDTLDQLAEIGIHDFEHPCEASNCNTHMEDDDAQQQLVCFEDDKSAAAAGSAPGWLFISSIMVLAASSLLLAGA